MKRLLVFLLCASAVFLSCKDNQIESALNSAEISMNDNPESSLEVLESIDKDLLSTLKQKAKYALLYSMALDKNYIALRQTALSPQQSSIMNVTDLLMIRSNHYITMPGYNTIQVNTILQSLL